MTGKPVVKKALGDVFDAKENLAYTLAKEEWFAEIGAEPSFGHLEYEQGSDIYRVNFGYSLQSNFGDTELFDFDDDFSEYIRPPRRPGIPERLPAMESFSAMGNFEVDVAKGEVMKQKIKIEKKSGWGQRWY